MPWFVDAGLLYYRKDLLEKHGASRAATLGELTETAQGVIEEAERQAGNGAMQGYRVAGTRL